VAHLERMNRGSGIKGQDDRSIGIEILMPILSRLTPEDYLNLTNTTKEVKLIRDDLHTNHNENSYIHTTEEVQLNPESVHRD
jgi:hypothetical protein